jgi:23S rRNA (pseudouridine1915-N3)-methyltransferase
MNPVKPAGGSMQFHLVAIGKLKEPFLRDGIAEYMKRLSGFCTIRVTEYPEERVKENAGDNEISDACRREGCSLLRSAGSADLIVALDPAGNPLKSEDFAGLIKKWEIGGPHHVAFLIGGPHGLSPEVRSRAGILLSLSLMTFPHQMSRLILLEQLYRAYTINKGLPYHR